MDEAALDEQLPVPSRATPSSTSISSSKRAGARYVADASTTTTSVPCSTTDWYEPNAARHISVSAMSKYVK